MPASRERGRLVAMDRINLTDALQAVSRLFGPVFWSEMVTTARRNRYFVLRVLFAGAMLFFLWTCYLSVDAFKSSSAWDIRDSTRLASSFFATFAWLALIGTLLVAPAIAAGTIATERERRTIEYLFATDLSNAEIVCSKLLSKLLLIGKLILVSVPVLAIFRIMGGIPGDLLYMYFIGLASTACFLSTLSVCISVWSPRARDAIIRVYLVLVVLFAVLPAIVSMVFGWLIFVMGPQNWLQQLGDVLQVVSAINPLFILGSVLSGAGGLGINFDPAPVWRMVYLHLAGSVLFAGIAIASVRRVHLRAVGRADKTERPTVWRLPRLRPEIGIHPMLWKEMFAKTAATKLGILGRVCLILVVCSVIGIVAVMFVSMIVESNSFGGYQAEAFVGYVTGLLDFFFVGTLILMGLRAASLVTYEKERDCWLSLISTPMTGSEIVWGKMLGNLYSFRWLAMPVAIVWVLALMVLPLYAIAIPFTAITFTAIALFATAVGLSYSLRFDSSLKAIAATLGTLLMVGGGYAFCCCVPVMVTARGGDEGMMIGFAGVVPFLLMIPGMLCVIGSPGNEWGVLVFTYVIGTFGYALAAFLLQGYLVTNFERLAGRTSCGSITVPRAIELPQVSSSPSHDE